MDRLIPANSIIFARKNLPTLKNPVNMHQLQGLGHLYLDFV